MTARARGRAIGAAVVAALGGPAVAMGQALPFHTDTAITAGFQENAARAFVSVSSRSELVRSGVELEDPTHREIELVAVPVAVIPYSFTPLWTTRVIVPYIDKRMELTTQDGTRVAFESSGIGDARLDTKWVFFRNDRPSATTRIGFQAGVKIPLGETAARLPTGSVAPRPLQLGSGSWDVPVEIVLTNVEDRWGFHGNLGWRINTEDDGFEAGDVLSYDLAAGLRLWPRTYTSLENQTLVGYLELNGEVARRDRVDGVRDPDSGGHVLFLTPDLQWIPMPWILVEGSIQLPIAQHLGGVQLEHEPRIQVGARVRFSVFR